MKVLDILSVPDNLDNSRARAYCTCSRYGWGCLDNFFSLVCLFFLCPSVGDGSIQTEILSQRAVKPQTTKQPSSW